MYGGGRRHLPLGICIPEVRWFTHKVSSNSGFNRSKFKKWKQKGSALILHKEIIYRFHCKPQILVLKNSKQSEARNFVHLFQKHLAPSSHVFCFVEWRGERKENKKHVNKRNEIAGDYDAVRRDEEKNTEGRKRVCRKTTFFKGRFGVWWSLIDSRGVNKFRKQQNCV